MPSTSEKPVRNFIKSARSGTLRALLNPTLCKEKLGAQDGLIKLAHLGYILAKTLSPNPTKSEGKLWTHS